MSGPSTGPRRRVLVVDDHRMFSQMLATALSAEPDLECVGIAHDAATALASARDLRPDVVVMDVRLGDGDGISAARELGQDLPGTTVVVLTAHGDPTIVRRAAEAEVRALLAKDGDLVELLSILRSPSDVTFTVGSGLPAASHLAQVGRLAAAGLAPEHGLLLRLLAAGLDSDAIARELGVDVRTAQAQVQDLVAALGARSPGDAVAVAVRLRLVQVGRG